MAKDVRIVLRLTAEEKSLLQKAAEAERLSLSAFMMRAALLAAKKVKA